MSDMETKVFLEEADVKKGFIPDNTNNKLICPFCEKKLEPYYGYGIELYSCSNLTCKGADMKAERDVWQELIRTRKALETLQEFVTKLYLNGNITDEQLERYKKTLKTALEQKDIK